MQVGVLKVVFPLRESVHIPFQARPVYHPNHVSVERLSRCLFDRRQAGMLEFEDQPVRRPNIGNMPLPIFRDVDNFLPVSRECILPRTMPNRLWLPPVLTIPHRSMCPMPNSLRTRPRHHWITALGTVSGKSGRGRNSLAVNHRKAQSPSEIPDVDHACHGSTVRFSENNMNYLRRCSMLERPCRPTAARDSRVLFRPPATLRPKSDV